MGRNCQLRNISNIKRGRTTMEINEKYRINWKNGFEHNDKTTHVKRYLFLLELAMFTIKQKDYGLYHKYRDFQEYINFTNNENFLAEDYDKTFLQTKTYDKKRKIKLIRDYRKNIEPPVRKLTNWIWFLKFFGVLAILYGILFFIPLNNVVIHDTSFYSFLFGIVCLGYIIIFTLYLKGKLNSIFLIKLLFMPTSVFIENLEYEKNCIEKFYYWMDNWDDLKLFFDSIPGARKTFEVLIDLKYIKIEDKSIIYNKPCTQQVFAEILRDPVFVFSSSISVTNDIFKNVFKKSINQMQQRNKDVSNTEEYKAVKEMLIKSGVPTNKEFLNEEEKLLLYNKHS